MPSRSAQTPKEEGKLPAAKLAVSYQRVSTKGQEFPRQKRARDQWLAKHPEYELLDTVEDQISGRKKNRFDWFIEHPETYPPGTVLLVEDIDRFSRMEVEDGIRQLLAIFDAGLGIAVCPYEEDDSSVWDRIGKDGVITSLNKGGQEIVRELERARRESERKRERSIGARDEKWAAIREGNLSAAFQPRGKRKSVRFPFWVEFNPKANDGRGAFEPNEHWPIIARIWELARVMGGARIAQTLIDEGFKSPYPRKGRQKAFSAAEVRKLLRERTALGEFQPVHRGNATAEPPIPGVFPPVVTEAEFKEIRGLIEARDTGLGAVKTKKQTNLFSNRSFCAQCGGLMGVQPQTNRVLADGTRTNYPGNFRCRVGDKTRGLECNVNGKQVGVRYEEERLLTMLHDFRWEDRYSSTAHSEELNKARQHLLAVQSVKNEKQRLVDNVNQGIEAALLAGQAPNPAFTKTLEKVGAELIDAENAIAIAENCLSALQAKPVGKEVARQARARVKAFTATGRNNLEEREAFNRWFHTTGLVVLVDPRTKNCDLCVARIEGDRVTEAWASEWALPLLQGEDRERYEAAVAKLSQPTPDLPDGTTSVRVTPTAEQAERRVDALTHSGPRLILD